MSEDDPPLRVMALHALAYCERLYYLEEVEEIRVANASVFAGRRLHRDLQDSPEDTTERHVLESERLGIRGAVDVVRRRDGEWIVYEHKRGRSRTVPGRYPEAWPSDTLQAQAYGLLVRECLARPVSVARIRYHADGRVVTVPIDSEAERAVAAAVARARLLRERLDRPPVTTNEHLCVRCSLAPVCLPEEERNHTAGRPGAIRLFPEEAEKTTVHVVSPGSRVKRAGDCLVVTAPSDGSREFGIETVEAVALHGMAQITTQALGLCASHDIDVHWITTGGRYLGTFQPAASPVQRRLRQFAALSDRETCVRLARRLVAAKLTGQLRFILRASRGSDRHATGTESHVSAIRGALGQVPDVGNVEVLRGLEGIAGRAYFAALPLVLRNEVPDWLRPAGRSRRPPLDPFNALLSFGYALLLTDVMPGLRCAGLDPAIGFLHAPRSATHPLALDLMELFRVPMVDMPVVASVNRLHWTEDDFVRTGRKVWLSESGRRKFIEVYERRKEERWKHPVVGSSLSYSRQIELEARLLEKEWTGRPGLFARSSIR